MSRKQRDDDIQTAELVAKGIAVPHAGRTSTAVCIGYSPQNCRTPRPACRSPIVPGLDSVRAPGTIPPPVNPPKASALAAAEEPSSDVTASASSTRIAAAANTASDGFFSNIARKVGIGGGSNIHGKRSTTKIQDGRQDRVRQD